MALKIIHSFCYIQLTAFLTEVIAPMCCSKECVDAFTNTSVACLVQGRLSIVRTAYGWFTCGCLFATQDKNLNFLLLMYVLRNIKTKLRLAIGACL